MNLGVSGDTTTDGVVRLPSVLALHPVLVVLEFAPTTDCAACL